jgi:hypothetical protein
VPVSEELRNLIRKFKIENPLWGSLNPKNAVEFVPPSFAGGFFCSLPIHRRFSKSPDPAQ